MIMSCKYKNECPSYSGWCKGPKQDFSRCIPFLVNAYDGIKKKLSDYEDYKATGLKPDDIPTALEMCKIKLALDNLKEYQNTGLTPVQIIQIDKLYREKCEELVRMKEVYGYTG